MYSNLCPQSFTQRSGNGNGIIFDEEIDIANWQLEQQISDRPTNEIEIDVTPFRYGNGSLEPAICGLW